MSCLVCTRFRLCVTRRDDPPVALRPDEPSPLSQTRKSGNDVFSQLTDFFPVWCSADDLRVPIRTIAMVVRFFSLAVNFCLGPTHTLCHRVTKFFDSHPSPFQNQNSAGHHPHKSMRHRNVAIFSKFFSFLGILTSLVSFRC